MKNRKNVLVLFQIYENDSLKDYLEHMAQNGWKLSKVDSLFLHFEVCKPHRIRYCVEIMEKPSVYASNQTPKQKIYREFCQEAGWDYVGNTGYFHIFCTEEEEAVLVETDTQERFERICQASSGNSWMFCALFGILILMNLYSCYLKKTLLCLNGWTSLILLTVSMWNIGGFYLWKQQAKKSLKESGNLPHVSWNFVRLKNNLAAALTFVLCTAPFIYSFRQSKSVFILYIVLLVYMFLLAMTFTKLLHWLKEKQAFHTGINILIYWGIAIAICAFSCSAAVAVIIFGWRI